MAPRQRREGWIDWTKCPGREILLDDLRSGLLPADPVFLSAEEAWEICYQHMAEFNTVVFSQFEARLSDHRRQINRDAIRASTELAALKHDRNLFPRQMYNKRGEPVFDLHPAKLLLRTDLAEQKHLTMTAHELQQSRPAEYMIFDPKIFRYRIFQELRRQKFINYLNEKRAQKHQKNAY